jgi:hypothetical protein
MAHSEQGRMALIEVAASRSFCKNPGLVFHPIAIGLGELIRASIK